MNSAIIKYRTSELDNMLNFFYTHLPAIPTTGGFVVKRVEPFSFQNFAHMIHTLCLENNPRCNPTNDNEKLVAMNVLLLTVHCYLSSFSLADAVLPDFWTQTDANQPFAAVNINLLATTYCESDDPEGVVKTLASGIDVSYDDKLTYVDALALVFDAFKGEMMP